MRIDWFNTWTAGDIGPSPAVVRAFVGGLRPKWGHRQLTRLTRRPFPSDVVLRATEKSGGNLR